MEPKIFAFQIVQVSISFYNLKKFKGKFERKVFLSKLIVSFFFFLDFESTTIFLRALLLIFCCWLQKSIYFETLQKKNITMVIGKMILMLFPAVLPCVLYSHELLSRIHWLLKWKMFLFCFWFTEKTFKIKWNQTFSRKLFALVFRNTHWNTTLAI